MDLHYCQGTDLFLEELFPSALVRDLFGMSV